MNALISKHYDCVCQRLVLVIHKSIFVVASVKSSTVINWLDNLLYNKILSILTGI
jgi:hypothetical protein